MTRTALFAGPSGRCAAAPMCAAGRRPAPPAAAQPHPAAAWRLAPQRHAAPLAAAAAPRRRGGRAARRAAAAAYGSAWSTPGDAYVALGLAHCFEKEDGGKLVDRFLIEPVTANGLEGMVAGTKTCYKAVFGTTLDVARARDRAALPPEFAGAAYCEDFDDRADACARTWMRPHAVENLMAVVPLGATKSGFNYSTDDKRVLNFENVVDDADNVKQDMSIDVYGRAAKEEAAAALAAAPGGAAAAAAPPTAAAAEEESEDELDALLA